ncbi:MAG: family transcriptional regulator [Bacteroidota bacterium]|nr:family transcriptional regulator [Bacteroidota bacterium]
MFFMIPTTLNLRSFRKQTCLTQKDIADLLGTKDVSQYSRHETSNMHPQLEICLLYHLLFNVPIDSFLPAQKEEMRKRLIRRIPNIIDEYRYQLPLPDTEAKISFLGNILSTLTSQIL